MKFVIIIFLLTITLVISFDDNISFDEWQTINDMKFSNAAEKKHRRQVFNAKRAEIKEHNKNKVHTYKKGVNKFTFEIEFKLSLLPLIAVLQYQMN